MEIDVNQLESESINILSPLRQQFCPECGAAMIETDRLIEDGATYIWYQCSKNGCDGSWLKKV